MGGAARDPRRVLVDGMNVIGSRPDGWWRDRAGAMARLVAAVDRWCAVTGARATVVLDGAPREVGPALLCAVTFARVADDELVRLVQEDPDPDSLTVATSDRGLVERLGGRGRVLGGGAFRALLDDPGPVRPATSARDPRVARAAALLAPGAQGDRGVAVDGADVLREVAGLGGAPLLVLTGSEAPAATPGVVVPAAPDALRALGALGQPAETVALLARPPEPDPCELPPGALVLCGVGDAGNVGTIVRTALALGRPRVLLDDGCASPWSRRALRASAGAALAPGLVATGADLEALAALEDRPPLAAAVPRGGLPPEELPPGTACVLGREADGLTAREAAACDLAVTVPAPGFESLNVAAAAAILAHVAPRS